MIVASPTSLFWCKWWTAFNWNSLPLFDVEWETCRRQIDVFGPLCRQQIDAFWAILSTTNRCFLVIQSTSNRVFSALLSTEINVLGHFAVTDALPTFSVPSDWSLNALFQFWQKTKCLIFDVFLKFLIRSGRVKMNSLFPL